MPFAPPPGLDEFLSSAPAPSVGREPASGAPAGLDDFISDLSKQEKYGSVGQQAKTVAEGLARGATFGGSDILESKLLGNTEDIKARQEINPIESMGSQALGGVGAIAATGGIAAPVEGAALGAEALEAGNVAFKAAEAAGLGAKAAARAAYEASQLAAGPARAAIAGTLGGAAEGAAFSAGNIVSEKALGNPNLTAEKILSEVGMGAALGGGVGLFGKVLETALPKATSKLSESIDSLKSKLSESAGTKAGIEGVVEGAPASAPEGSWAKSFYQGMAQADPATSARTLSKNLQEVVDSGKAAATDLYETAAPANFKEALKEMPVENAKSIGQDVLKEMASTLQGVAEDGSALSNLSPANTKIVSSQMGELAKSIEEAGSAAQVHKALDGFAKDFDKTIKFDKLPTAAQSADQDLLRGVRNIVRGSLKSEDLWGEAAQHYAQTGQNYSEYTTALKNFQSAFMKRTVSPSGGKRFIVDPGKVQTFFNRFNDVSQDLKKQYLDEFMNKTQNLAKASESYHGYQAAGDSISGRIIEAAKKNKDLADIASALSAQKGSVDKSVLAGLGGDLIKATALHAMGIPNPVVGAGLLAMDAYKSVQNPYALGKNIAVGLDKLHAISEMAQNMSEKIATAARSAVAGTATRGAAISIPAFASAKGYDKRVERIEALASENPTLLMDHLTKHTQGISDYAPNTSQAIQSKMINAVQFLQSKIPRPAAQLPMSGKWEPSEQQKEKFNNYCRLVDDPVSILKEVKSGTVTIDSINTIAATHPEILKEMRMEVMSNLHPKKAEGMSYSSKIALSKFLGEPLTQSLIPGVMASNQIPSAPQQPGGQPAPGSSRKAPLGGLKQLSLASRTRPRNPENDPD